MKDEIKASKAAMRSTIRQFVLADAAQHPEMAETEIVLEVQPLGA